MSANDQRSSVSRLMSLVVIVVAGLWAPQSMAQQWGATPQEQAMCRQMVPRPANPSPDWGHMHHFCDCIRFRHRAMGTMGDANRFKFNIREAIDGCNYVLNHASAGFAMRPHIHVEKGRALSLSGDKPAAEQEFRRALQMNPSVVAAYLELAQLLQASGRRSEALELTDRGLRHNPNHKGLQKAYLDAGGREPFPEPIRPQPTERRAAVTPPAEAPAEAPSAGIQASATSQAAADGTDDAPRSEQADDASNCRFCPPETIVERWRESFK